MNNNAGLINQWNYWKLGPKDLYIDKPFTSGVLDGSIIHTVRKSGPCSINNTLNLLSADNSQQLGRARVVAVRKIRIEVDFGPSELFILINNVMAHMNRPKNRIYLDGSDKYLEYDKVKELIDMIGFKGSVIDFFYYCDTAYGLPLDGILIKWKMIKEGDADGN